MCGNIHGSFPRAVTEFVRGGELFAAVENFNLALVQLYVLEIAIALGTCFLRCLLFNVR